MIVLKNHSRILTGIVLTMVVWLGSAEAFLYTPQTSYKYGAVFTRSTVLGPNNKPIYVVYNKDTGKEMESIGEAVGELADVRVMAVDYYQSLLEQLTKIQINHPDLEIIQKGSFNPNGFVTVANEPITGVPALKEGTLYVAVLGPDERFSTDGEQLILLELSINPYLEINPESQVLLLSKEGAILKQTEHNIGYRVAFFGADDKQADTLTRKQSDEIFGPLQGVGVTLGDVYFGGSVTNEEGKYGFGYMLPPCPGFTFEYTTNVYVELSYRRFSPRGEHTYPYFLARPGYDFCNGLSAITPGFSLSGLMTQISIANTISINHNSFYAGQTDFLVDLMVLSGKAKLYNPDDSTIPVGGATKYDHTQEPFERAAQTHYDLDGDGQDDVSHLGRIDTLQDGSKQFVRLDPGANPPIQGVWLSSQHQAANFTAIRWLRR